MSWRDLSVVAKAARYAAVKDTPAYLEQQRQAEAAAVDAIAALGYTRARAAVAASEYAVASRDTVTGPDWDRFVGLVARVGLVRPGPVTGRAAELEAIRLGADTPVGDVVWRKRGRI